MRLASPSGGYSPQQLRAAYSFPAIPSNLATATPAELAALGAGQTIYVIGAYHDANVFSYLNTYSQHFGLPTCTQTTVPTGTPLPLPAAGSSCTITAVGASSSGQMSTLPASNANWGVEEALDVQLAHASAPLARIVIVAAQGSDSASLAGAIALANKMGSGVVSMSFGAADSSAFATYDSRFAVSGMTYVAATGDQGAYTTAARWPAAVPTVLAVGATSMNWNGATRVEEGWIHGGGGMSSWRPAPAYQQGYSSYSSSSCNVPTGRMLPDVAINGDGVTGYALYVPINGTAGWYSVGGTSASAPVWGGVLAVANAQRVRAGKPALGTSVHQVLYQSLGNSGGAYTSNFNDVSSGSNGSCATCSAGHGYDQVSGLGTPRVSSLLTALVAH